MNHTRFELLLIEDNVDDVDITLRTLRKHEFITNIRVLTDGVEALEYIFGDTNPSFPPLPQVILLDLKLPRISGLDVLRKLKSDERTKTTPVVVLTSSQQDPDVAECYKLGVNSYIVKPVDFDDFAEAVHQLGSYWALLNKVPMISC